MADRYEFEEHTSEVLVRLTAGDFAGLLVQAGLALAELETEGAPGEPGPVEEVRLNGPDRGALLVAWIDELIFRSEHTKRIYRAFEVARATPREVVATIRGSDATALKTQVKAATYHRLRVEAGPEGFVGEVVLDV